LHNWRAEIILEEMQIIALEFLETGIQYDESEKAAMLRLTIERPSFSTNIAEFLTCGYGMCSEFGEFEFPLPAWIADKIECAIWSKS
jgi:hypothetical protein